MRKGTGPTIRVKEVLVVPDKDKVVNEEVVEKEHSFGTAKIKISFLA